MVPAQGPAEAGPRAPAAGHMGMTPAHLASISDVDADPVTEEAVFIGTIALVLFLQYVTHRLDGVTRRHKHISDMINMMYRELMILGLVAFLLFAITAAGVHVAKEDKIVFEVIHHGLFIVVVIYAASVVTLAVLSLVTSHHWNRYERLGFEQWVECRDEFNDLRERLERMPAMQRLCNPRLHLRYWTLIEVVRFHDLRYHFLHANSLATHFRFATYLKKCKQHVFLELTEIHDRVWALLAGVLVVDLYLRGLIPSYATVADPTPMLIVISVVAVIVCFAVYKHITSVYFAILHDESTEFDASLAVAPDLAEDDPPAAPEPRAAMAGGSAAASAAPSKRALSLPRPTLLLSLLQLALFALCLAAALSLSFHPRVRASPYGTALGIVLPVCFVLVVLLLARTTPRFTIALHAGDHVDANVLERTIEKQQQARKRELEQEHETRRRIRRQVRRLRRRARLQMRQYSAAGPLKSQYGHFRSKAASEAEEELLDAKTGHDSDTTVSSDGEMDDGEWVLHTCCPRAVRRWIQVRWAQCGSGDDAVPPAEAVLSETATGSANPLVSGATRSSTGGGGTPWGALSPATEAKGGEERESSRPSASGSAFRVHGNESGAESADPETGAGATWDPPASPPGPRPPVGLTLERLASRNVSTDDLVEELYARGKQSGGWRQHLVVAHGQAAPAPAPTSSAGADAAAAADASDVREVTFRESRMQERRADRKRRDRAEQFSRSKRYVVALMVMLDMFAVALRQFPAAEDSAGDLLYAVECVVATAFLLELAAEVSLHGPREFLRDPWRIVDGVVIVAVAVITFASPSFVAAHALVVLRLLRSIIMVGLLSLPLGRTAKGHDAAEPAEEAGHSTAGSESESADEADDEEDDEEDDEDDDEDEEGGEEGGEKAGDEDGEGRDDEVAAVARGRERGSVAVLGPGVPPRSGLPSAVGAHSQLVRVQSHEQALSAAGHRRTASGDGLPAGAALGAVATGGTGEAGEGAGTTSRHSLSRSSTASQEQAPRLGLPSHLDTAPGTAEPSPTPWDAPTPSSGVPGGTGPAPSPAAHGRGRVARYRAQTQKRLSVSLRRLVPAEPVDLTGDTFEHRVLNTSLPWVVMFYTPWSRQCAKLWPKWPEIARRLRKHGVCAGQAHAEKNAALAHMCNVEHYPSILVFTAGAKTLEASVHYNGPLHRADILDFVLETVHYDRTSALHHGRRPTLALAAATEAEGAAAVASAHHSAQGRSQSLVSLRSYQPQQSPRTEHAHGAYDSGDEDGHSTESVHTAAVAKPRIQVGMRVPTDPVPTVRVLPARESSLRFRRSSQNTGGGRTSADNGAAPAEGDRLVSTERIFRGRRVLLIGVPGAFSPVSTETHLPGFVDYRDRLRDAGVKEFVCVTVNDPSVTRAWADATNARDFMTFVADWDGAFTRVLGMRADLSHISLGARSRRYAAVLDDGIVKHLLLEEGGAEEEPAEATHAARVLQLLQQ